MTLHRCERQSTLGSNSVLGHVSIQDADNIFSHSMALLSPGRKKISCRYGASWTGERRAPGMTEWGRTGVNAACSRGCLVWNRDGRAEDNCVLPEVNIVLSAAQLSSHSRIYFNNCWRKEGGRRRGGWRQRKIREEATRERRRAKKDEWEKKLRKQRQNRYSQEWTGKFEGLESW